MRVFWTPKATGSYRHLAAHAADNLCAAARMDELFSDAAARPADPPKLGRPGKISGTRELVVHESYRLVHEIEGEAVWVLTLVHTARQWPPVRQTW